MASLIGKHRIENPTIDGGKYLFNFTCYVNDYNKLCIFIYRINNQ